MNYSVWIMAAGNIFKAPGAEIGLVIGVVAATILCILPGVAGILMARQSESPRAAVLLQLAPLAAGCISALAGLLLMLLKKSPAVSVGLQVGGVLAVLDSCCFMVVVAANWRQKQRWRSDGIGKR